MRMRGWWILVVWFLGQTSFMSCKKDEPPPVAEGKAPATPAPVSDEESDNATPRVREITLSPARPTLKDEIKASAEGEDPNGEYVSLSYQWYVNDRKLLGQISSSLPAGLAQRDDTVEVEVTPRDGQAAGPAKRSESLKIYNTGPVLAKEFAPGQSLDGYRMEVSDADNDPITYKLEGAPPNMSVSADGVIHWQPQADDKAGRYDIKLTADDGHGGTVAVTVPVDVVAGSP